MRALINWLSQIVVGDAAQPPDASGSGSASSLVAVVGIAGVVAVFVAVLSMAEGFRQDDGHDRLAGHRHRHARRAPTAR